MEAQEASKRTRNAILEKSRQLGFTMSGPYVPPTREQKRFNETLRAVLKKINKRRERSREH